MSDALEQPEQSYYPGARLRLILRFDDPSRKRFNRVPPGQPVTLTRGKAKPALEVKVIDGKMVLVDKTAGVSKSSPIEQSISDDQLTQEIGGIIPLRAALSLNGIRTASTLTVEVPFSDMPIEPRMIRGCAVEFYLGTVTNDQFSRGVAGETRQGGDGSAEPVNIIPKTYTDGFGRQRTNSRFIGWVDDWEVTWGDGVPIVKLSCRDQATLLIDTEAPPQLTINPKKPIDRAFAEYLAFFPQFSGLQVVYQPTGEPPPVLQQALMKTAYKPVLGPAAGGKQSVYDYFTDVAGAIGHIVRFEGLTLIIQKPRTYYGGKFPRREDDPFRGYTLPSGNVMPFRLFVYGRNVLSYNVKRKFTVAGPTTIEVRCYSTRLKRTLVERYPLKKDRLERGLPGSVMPDEKINVIRVRGIGDEKTLRAVAQSVYEQLGRNEIEVTLATRDLATFGGNLMDPNLLDCKPGDTIELAVTHDEETAQQNFASDSERAAYVEDSTFLYLKKLGYGTAFASAYAAAKKNSILQPLYRVKRIEFTWDVERGIDITTTAINYIEVRGDSLPQGEEPSEALTIEDARKAALQEAAGFGIIQLLKSPGVATEF